MIIVQGEVLRRITLNKQRLSDKIYRYPEVFKHHSDWPGDFEGRAILALISLYKAFVGYKIQQNEIMDQLNEIISHLNEYTNEDGYFGKKFDGKTADEQQISGNSWFIRGLIEYYKITSNKEILNRINSIFNNFVFKLLPFYEKYNNSYHNGEVSGSLSKNVEDYWLYSSDIGCAFIMLDSIGSYCKLTNDEKVFDFAEKVINKFQSINILKNKLQTHATLSCTRGILKVYEASKKDYLLELAAHYFDLYVNEGMTLDYSNYNWFGLVDSRTEPCCIVDSFIVAHKLYTYTKDFKYLRLLNRIYYNGIRGAQRSNGGAGCNTCLKNEECIIKIHLYEAFFCCTMRLGEGLQYISSHLFDENDDTIDVNLLEESTLKSIDGELRIENSIYSSNDIKISNSTNKDLRIYMPLDEFKIDCKYTQKGNYILINKDVRKINIHLDYLAHKENAINFIGDIILTRKNNSSVYSYITNFIDLSEEEAFKTIQEL
ncbi:MAG: glycoside hydrolase family 127 protein [Candidatus Onthovivens sp.]|nr:glycoside hydrolase family 127 protein [Candidatus Onthovivens sp.]